MKNELPELKPNGLSKFLTRQELATRWRCSGETIKRRQRSGVLHPIYLSPRKILYRLSQIERLEADGEGGLT
jgi:hypothetical protein